MVELIYPDRADVLEQIDLLAQGRIGRTTASLRYADYQADRYGADTQKLWLQLDWTI